MFQPQGVGARMNYIDITENKKTHSVKNRVINIINREGIQGPKGADGITPHINQDNGHWMLGDIDTQVEACGKPGATPYIDAEGYWCIDGQRLGVKATGINGADGATPYIDNTTYHWFINGEDTGVSALGLKGDSPVIKDGHWWIGDNDTGFEVGIKQEDIPQIIYCQNIYCFPTIGNTKNLYVDESKSELYRWNGSYFCRFETSYDFIDCGKANDYEISFD